MDVFYTSSSEQESFNPAVPNLSEGAVLAAPATPATTADRATSHLFASSDAAVWRAWLEQHGFSPAEAGRLIFERLCPRDEGTARG